MNLLNKLFKGTEINTKKGEDLKSRLKECMINEDRTMEKDHVNPQEYMELLIKYKSNPEDYNLEVYSKEMDAIDAAMAEVKHAETIKRLRDTMLGGRR